ncbi:uncharacterized protein LACBIDRAFT_308894 [Laccaria bicolor S238N-H82]|uniref:Predicted protein n=1 Tax=Laccaria bicolor (strain S238N-H82 / ATCC MYA-4686) TaxID=486041 RepID=B0CV08_LACBS|nr:uncharacterized protein LACBIDRAFT_308894 [Laccaria bicolor S238N-H82]EDR13666.1 predicted protein [Laccaria bicolor S238N-H82]|eukprot:XP_001876164.1 predicted protein [Laccaria bicolor S238N-H82]
MIFPSLLLALATAGTRLATASIIYDGRAPFNLTNADLDVSAGPYLTVVKGALNASHYSTLLGHSLPPTPLWNKLLRVPAPIEQAISVTIDNSSVFVPGAGPPQFGFRRTELIAQKNGDHANLVPLMESGVTAFHFSIKQDEKKPLNYSHEYQIVFIEPNDGSHVFGIQLGSPFTIPTGILPAANAHSFKVLDHALNVIFQTSFSACHWHNFAIQVDWDNRSLAVLYSKDDDHLAAVTAVVPNLSAASGSAGQGDFHFGVLKLPLVNPVDSAADQGDVAHHGLQEGTTEGLLYSGVFVESVESGISVGAGASIAKIG